MDAWNERVKIKNEDLNTDRIREDIQVNLTDLEYKDIKSYAYKAGFETIGSFLSSFVGDLTGVHSNGSDECEFADQWFERAFGSWRWCLYFRSYLYENSFSLDDMEEMLEEEDYFKDVYGVYKECGEGKEIEEPEECRKLIQELVDGRISL